MAGRETHSLNSLNNAWVHPWVSEQPLGATVLQAKADHHALTARHAVLSVLHDSKYDCFFVQLARMAANEKGAAASQAAFESKTYLDQAFHVPFVPKT